MYRLIVFITMKNLISKTKACFNLFSIITIIAIMGVMPACDKKGNDKKVTAKYRFTGTPTTSKSIFETGKSQASVSSVPGIEDFTEFYGNLGAKKGTFTPTEMIMAVGSLTIMEDLGNGANIRLINSVGTTVNEGIKIVDFARPITISADEIQSGFYNMLNFTFSDSFADEFATTGWDDLNWLTNISFPKPAALNLETHAYSTMPSSVAGFGYLNKTDGNITVLLSHLQPASVDYHWGSFTTGVYQNNPLGTNVGGVNQLFFAGDSYIVAPCESTEKTLDQFIPGAIHLGVSNASTTGIIIPFEGINVPEDAKAVRFEIIWDIENIVEWYEGPDNTTTNDDIFVLKNGFWEGFSLKAYIEY